MLFLGKKINYQFLDSLLQLINGRGGNFFKIPQSLYLSMFYNIFYILKHFFKTLILVLI